MLVILLTAWPAISLASQNEQPQDRDQRWLQDIEFFAKQFPVLQMDADKLIPPAKFRAEIKGIEDDIPHLSDSEIVLRLIHLVASAGVGHDSVFWLNGPYALHRYPLRFAWFSDGPAVTSAAAEYESALGARVLRIGSMTPQEFESAAASYYPYENLSRLRAQGPVLMMTREIATHFGLAASDGSVDITLAKPGEEPFHVRVAPAATGQEMHLISWAQAHHLPEPIYRRNLGSNYWYQYLPEAKTLYIQYTVCAEDPKKPFKDFVDEMFRFVDSKMDSGGVGRVIVDLRLNGGGSDSVIRPLLSALEARPSLVAKGHLFVLMSGNTFSSGMSAVFALRDEFHAILIGEPVGERPNTYGGLKTLTLPNSGVQVAYTTKYFRFLKDSDPSSLDPDLPVQRSVADLLNNRDPVLDAALNYH